MAEARQCRECGKPITRNARELCQACNRRLVGAKNHAEAAMSAASIEELMAMPFEQLADAVYRIIVGPSMGRKTQ